jgi:hypothetical protein
LGRNEVAEIAYIASCQQVQERRAWRSSGSVYIPTYFNGFSSSRAHRAETIIRGYGQLNRNGFFADRDMDKVRGLLAFEVVDGSHSVT